MKLTDKEIINALEAGKGIRRKEWSDGYFVFRRAYTDLLYDRKGSILTLYVEYLKVDDWETE